MEDEVMKNPDILGFAEGVHDRDAGESNDSLPAVRREVYFAWQKKQRQDRYWI
ncbi:hypothetical protein [Paenibacillus thalictri]|uniref:hypothetical protein n=1 Tax=Paenibacillus thalictri TaxID=2527873 RepID=UPI0013EF573B|nr:hypothetical protein [Paenibacillus thalictri]